MKLEVIASEELKKFGLPKFQTEGAAAIDLRALLNSPLTQEKLKRSSVTTEIETDDDDNDREVRLYLHPGQMVTVDSGLKIHIDSRHHAGIVLPRSSSGKKGLVLANGTGLIDSDYQGPLLLMLWNRGTDTIVIEDGERVAQYLLTSVFQFDMHFVDTFSGASVRGDGGFGSTGAK